MIPVPNGAATVTDYKRLFGEGCVIVETINLSGAEVETPAPWASPSNVHGETDRRTRPGRNIMDLSHRAARKPRAIRRAVVDHPRRRLTGPPS